MVLRVLTFDTPNPHLQHFSVPASGGGRLLVFSRLQRPHSASAVESSVVVSMLVMMILHPLLSPSCLLGDVSLVSWSKIIYCQK